MNLAAFHPTLQFLFEGLVPLPGEGPDAVVIAPQKILISIEAECGLFHLERVVAFGKVPADSLQFPGADFVEANLIEEP